LHRRAAEREQPADLERHVGARRALPRLRAQRERGHPPAPGANPRRPHPPAILARTRADASATEGKLTRADRIFIVLELVLLVAFFATLGALAGRLFAPRWIVLCLVVAIGTLVPLAMSRTPSAGRRGSPVLAGWLVLLGGLALRIVVVFGA